MLRIKLVKSPIGNTARNRKVVASLGLRKMHQTVEHNDTPSIRGMVHHVKHLLSVEEVADATPKAKAAAKAAKPKAEAAAPAEVAAKPAKKAKATEENVGETAPKSKSSKKSVSETTEPEPVEAKE